MGSCSRCNTNWTGHRLEHCPECHITLTGTTAGDKHRTGDHAVTTGPDRRRCRTPEEMRNAGLVPRQTRQGLEVWGLPAPETPIAAFSIPATSGIERDRIAARGPILRDAVEICGPSSPPVGTTTGDDICGPYRNGDVA